MPAGMSGAYNKLWWTSFIFSPCWGWWWLMSKGATSQNRWLGFFPFSLSSPSHSRCIIIIMVMMVIFFILHRCSILLSGHIVITGNFCECSLNQMFRLGTFVSVQAWKPGSELGTGRHWAGILPPGNPQQQSSDRITIWQYERMTRWQKLPRIANCWPKFVKKFPKGVNTSTCCLEFPIAAKSCHWLPRIAKSCQKLSKAAKSYQKMNFRFGHQKCHFIPPKCQQQQKRKVWPLDQPS